MIYLATCTEVANFNYILFSYLLKRHLYIQVDFFSSIIAREYVLYTMINFFKSIHEIKCLVDITLLVKQ